MNTNDEISNEFIQTKRSKVTKIENTRKLEKLKSLAIQTDQKDLKELFNFLKKYNENKMIKNALKEEFKDFIGHENYFNKNLLIVVAEKMIRVSQKIYSKMYFFLLN